MTQSEQNPLSRLWHYTRNHHRTVVIATIFSTLNKIFAYRHGGGRGGAARGFDPGELGCDPVVNAIVGAGGVNGRYLD
jgi:hypothetical protein